MTSVDPHQFLYGLITSYRGCPQVSLRTNNMWPWPSTNFYMDVIMKSMDVYQFLYFVWAYNMRPWTSTCVYIDVKHDNRGRPSVSILTLNYNHGRLPFPGDCKRDHLWLLRFDSYPHCCNVKPVKYPPPPTTVKCYWPFQGGASVVVHFTYLVACWWRVIIYLSVVFFIIVCYVRSIIFVMNHGRT